MKKLFYVWLIVLIGALLTSCGQKAEIALWGDPDCTQELGEAFAPHGIHLGLDVAGSGSDRLLVVNHGLRESIEIFELIDVGGNVPSLKWRGCVIAPESIWFNDVANLPDGGFIASHMMKRGISAEELLSRQTNGEPTGYALSWNSENGWKKIDGSDGILTNGVQTSPEGGVLYAAYSLGQEVRAIDLSTGKTLWQVDDVQTPDNISWTPSGQLLVASIRADLPTIRECMGKKPAFCPIPFGILSIDPLSGESFYIAEGEGPPFGLATVGVLAGSKIYMGSATGERLGIVEKCIDPSGPCEADGGISFMDGFAAPEDFEVLPGETRLLVSEYGGLGGEHPGTIKLLDLETQNVRMLYPGKK